MTVYSNVREFVLQTRLAVLLVIVVPLWGVNIGGKKDL